MKKIRIGNDIVIKWRVTINGEEVNLEGLDLALYISTTYQPRKAIAFTVAGNEITATYKGAEQKVTGVYRLTLYRNEGENAQSILDACDAFELVSCSCLTTDVAFGGAEVELPIADLGIGVPGLSAYEIAVAEGFEGTQEEWIASLSAASEAAAAECREFTEAAKISEKDRQDKEALRITAEDERAANERTRALEEQKRVTAESLRVSAEVSRKTAEEAREADEQQRSTAEVGRSSAEELRKSNEQSRISEETTRSNNEAARIAAETKRVNAESTRKNNEDARKSAETSRQSSEATRETAERSRTAAESQRVANETARSNAESSRATAETARQSAETARQEAEQGRVTAEQQRADAEAARAEEFATFEGKIAAKEDAANKVTSINADADDTHYPSAKAVKDKLDELKDDVKYVSVFVKADDLNKFIVKLYIEDKEKSKESSLYLYSIDYKYNAFYFGTSEKTTAIYLYMKNLPNGNKFGEKVDETFGKIYIEVTSGDGNQHLSVDKQNILDNSFNGFSYLTQDNKKRIDSLSVQLAENAYNIRKNIGVTFSATIPSAWSPVALDNPLKKGDVICQADTPFYLRTDYGGSKQKEVNILPFEVDDDYYYITHSAAKVVNGEIDSSLRKIREDVNSNKNTSVLLNQVLNGNLSEELYCTDENLAPFVVNIYIKDKIIFNEQRIYLSFIDYKYNAFYFGKVGGSKTAFSINMKTKSNGNKYAEVVHQTYGYIYIEVLPSDGEQHQSKADTENLTLKAFNYFAEGGLVEAFKGLRAGANNTLWNKNVLVIGDSLTAAGVWQLKLNELLGMNVSTHAKGGMGIVQCVDGENINNDGTIDNNTNASGILQPLSTADVQNKDLIIFFAGYNNRGKEDGEANGIEYPTANTISGMMQHAINRIYQELENANNKKCKIAIITPHCVGKYSYIDADGYDEYPSGSGRNLRTLASAIERVSKYNSIPCLNLWENSGINRNTWSVFSASQTATNTDGSGPGPYHYNNDQVHLNSSVGYPYLGEKIANWIKTI